MNRLLFNLSVCLAAAALVSRASALAQNLLTENTGFEANTGYYTPGWGYPDGSPDALPGWVIILDPTGDGYAGAASNQSPQELEGTHFGYIYSGTGTAGLLETAPASRAPVEAGTNYTLWFLARGDAPWGDATATVSLIWYANQSNDTTKGDPVTLELTLPARTSTTDPMQTFHIAGVAPNGAHYAGVRIARPAYNYDPVIVDGFVIMADPAEVSLSIQKKDAGTELRWPRSSQHDLEEKDGLALASSWEKTKLKVKALGATNYVACPLTNSARFFRLTAPN